MWPRSVSQLGPEPGDGAGALLDVAAVVAQGVLDVLVGERPHGLTTACSAVALLLVAWLHWRTGADETGE